jgi:steroid 5-alpha reductase family enzyme
VKLKYFINAHKSITFVAILIMMAIYKQWQNPTAWAYLALHGTYGILWVLKSLIFPDKSWEVKKSLPYNILIVWGGLTLYWLAPWLLMSRSAQVEPWYLGICICAYIFGMFFHFVSDMQKYTSLELRPGHLISDGMMGLSRNINYFGEFLIYASFASLSKHWIPFIVILIYIVFYWGPRMAHKEKSLARYPEFAEYKSKTRFFVPFIF